MTENNIYFTGESPEMTQAFINAQNTFKYFWRELSWEYKRVVPALDIACVKVIFTQKARFWGKDKVEHMWINDVYFNGETVKGTLANPPNVLTNIKMGASVEVPLHQISDWIFAINEKVHGGFTIQVMRSEMNQQAQQEHDNAWGLDFGDNNDILIAYEQKEQPENLIEHPMSKSMEESIRSYVQQNPNELERADEFGYTILHKEAIAGNKTSVEILKNAGVNLQSQTNTGKTALDFAKLLQWKHIIPVLEG